MDSKFFTCIICLAASTFSSFALTYNGATLPENNTFVRTQCGTTNKSEIKEASGLACSRVTPGYLWAVWDEGCTQIAALRPDGSRAMLVTLTGLTNRDDWEDVCTGVKDGINYVFIGAFGDNYSEWNDQYYINYFPEPTITSGSATLAAQYIRFGFPDAQPHNVETLMFDNQEQMFYIVDKVEGQAATLYKLPFRTDYNGLQRLTMVAKLGRDGEKFDRVTGGDISPDGRWMAIKNESRVLLWERQGNESLSTTITRQPQLVKAYQKEEQGESLAWKDGTTFYTTSDSKNNTPVYMYVRNGGTPDPGEATSLEDTPAETAVKRIENGQLIITTRDGLRYTHLGIRVE